MYHHLEDMGGFDFSVSGWLSLCFIEFESLDSAVYKVAWGYQKPKKVHSQCHCGDEVCTSSV
jgi:hypothetical protein